MNSYRDQSILVKTSNVVLVAYCKDANDVDYSIGNGCSTTDLFYKYLAHFLLQKVLGFLHNITEYTCIVSEACSETLL